MQPRKLISEQLKAQQHLQKHTIVHHLHTMLAHKLMSLELRLIELLVTANNAGIKFYCCGGSYFMYKWTMKNQVL
jgi:hypothetical protein